MFSKFARRLFILTLTTLSLPMRSETVADALPVKTVV